VTVPYWLPIACALVGVILLSVRFLRTPPPDLTPRVVELEAEVRRLNLIVFGRVEITAQAIKFTPVDGIRMADNTVTFATHNEPHGTRSDAPQTASNQQT
jgi:hypothetical protein